jgi:hypothetical protein
VKIAASNAVIKFKKKSHKKLQLELDEQVKVILENLEIGDTKKGDLQGIRVHKFNFQKELYLLAYEVIEDGLRLYMVGVHENFYKKLKKLIS